MAKASAAASKPVHLVVLCHGMWGEPKHLHTLEEQLRRSFGTRATVVRPKERLDQGQVGGTSAPSLPLSSSSSSSATTKVPQPNTDEGNPRTEYTASQEDLLRRHAARVRDGNNDDDNGGGGGVEMDVVILNTSSNRGGKTYDGIDWLAERVVREINQQVTLLAEQGRYVARFSMVGYSLGGLVVRFVLGLLEHQGFFAGRPPIQARQIITIATPHIGSPPGAGLFGRLVGYVGARLLSRTGEQIYGLDDGWQTEGENGGDDAQPSSQHHITGQRRVGLLEHMAEPRSIFIRALNRFEKVHFYANAVNDVTVPFRTGCIEAYDPFVEQAGHVDVELLDDAPILTAVTVVSDDERKVKSFMQRLPSLPVFFNPKRLPFSFPYNYIVVVGSPVLFPVFVATIIYRLSKDSKKSRARIEELERGWSSEQQPDEAESRIVRLLKGVVMSAGEDNVEQERQFLSSSPLHDNNNNDEVVQSTVHGAVASAAGTDEKAPWHTPWHTRKAAAPKPVKQLPLSDAQLAIIRNLNDAAVLPRMRKVWVYFPDVTNAHAMIIARSLTVEPHWRGLPIIKHIVDDFLP